MKSSFQSETKRLESIAAEASEIGGSILLEYFGSVRKKSIIAKGIGDWVSEADLASEKAIVDYLGEVAPNDEIITEETGHIKPDTIPKYRWIIDPLDGTTNFLRGFPIWAVSVAVEKLNPTGRWGPILAGAINIPSQHEIFNASVGNGAYRNGDKLSQLLPRILNECLFATGFPFRTRELIPDYSKLLADVLLRSADVRRPGAVAVDLCYVAAGIFDGFWELDLAPWDIAAGALIIREAGGTVGDFQGEDDFLTTGDIIAGQTDSYGELLSMIKNYFPTKRKVDKFPNRK